MEFPETSKSYTDRFNLLYKAKKPNGSSLYNVLDVFSL